MLKNTNTANGAGHMFYIDNEANTADKAERQDRMMRENDRRSQNPYTAEQRARMMQSIEEAARRFRNSR